MITCVCMYIHVPTIYNFYYNERRLFLENFLLLKFKLKFKCVQYLLHVCNTLLKISE